MRRRTFTQIKHPCADITLGRLMIRDSSAAGVFFILMHYMDNINESRVTVSKIAELLKCSESSVKRGIKTLTDEGFILTSLERTHNVYHLNAHLVWYGTLKMKYDDRIFMEDFWNENT